jgi:hypothetical protein
MRRNIPPRHPTSGVMSHKAEIFTPEDPIPAFSGSGTDVTETDLGAKIRYPNMMQGYTYHKNGIRIRDDRAMTYVKDMLWTSSG